MTEDEMITDVMRREGWDQYTDNPADKGGPTKWGITLAAWSRFLGRPCSAVDVQVIPEDSARRFYRQRYVLDPKFDMIADAHLRELCIDAGVNHGPDDPSRWLQQAVGVVQDGVLGQVSLTAINNAAPLGLILWVCAFRFRLYGRLTSHDPVLDLARKAGFHLQAEFTSGWCNRVAEFLESTARDVERLHKEDTGADDHREDLQRPAVGSDPARSA